MEWKSRYLNGEARGVEGTVGLAVERWARSCAALGGQVDVVVNPLAPLHEDKGELLILSDVLVGCESNFVWHFSNLQKIKMKMYVTIPQWIYLSV